MTSLPRPPSSSSTTSSSSAELAKTQRKMSRRFAKGKAPSNGYKRARRDAAKVHAKGVRQNVHDTRVWAKAVVEHHQLIAVDDFKPMFLAKSTMAAKSADAAVGAAKHELVERGLRAGRTVVLVPPAYTTMTCSNYAWRNNTRLGLGMRTFRCEACGFEAGRDWNAARVILATGERIRAGVDDVRHLLPPLEDVVGAVRVRNPPASAVGNRQLRLLSFGECVATRLVAVVRGESAAEQFRRFYAADSVATADVRPPALIKIIT
jgi:putative transposase